MVQCGDLCKGQFAVDPQPEHLPVRFGQGMKLLVKAQCSFPLLQFLPRQGGGAGHIRQSVVQRGQFPLLPPVCIRQGVFGNLTQPDIQCTAALEPVNGIQRLVKGLLGQFCCQFLVLAQCHQVSVHGLVILQINLLKTAVLHVRIPPFWCVLEPVRP